MTARSLKRERFELKLTIFDALSRQKNLKNLTAVAQALGVSHSTISRLRAGKTSASMALMLRCEALFGVPASDLFTRVEEPND